MAQITIKKALRLRKELEAQVKSPTLPLTVSLSVYVAGSRERPQEAIDRASDAMAEKVSAQSTLSRILRDLRIQVAKANVAGDIEGLLASSAHVERQIALEKILVAAALRPSDEEVTGRINQAYRLVQSEEQSYGQRESVDVSVVSLEMKERSTKRIAELRREKEALDDRRTAANMAQSIEIAEDDVQFLRGLGLI